VKALGSVIPAKAGIHFASGTKIKMDSGLRRNDEMRAIRGFDLTKHDDTNG